MRKFNVNVNGKSYAVEVEEIGGEYAAPAVKSVAPAPVAAPSPAAAVASGAGTPVKSPMPGLVKKLCFSNGADVKSGDTVIILEAMKMDTPVVASCNGKISYSTSEGNNVDTGAVLCTIA